MARDSGTTIAKEEHTSDYGEDYHQSTIAWRQALKRYCSLLGSSCIPWSWRSCHLHKYMDFQHDYDYEYEAKKAIAQNFSLATVSTFYKHGAPISPRRTRPDDRNEPRPY
jgi:hypothetical protein